jgi:hypothetical protein
MNEFAAPDGLSVDELKWCLAQIAGSQSIRAASVTAYDPAADAAGRAAGSATGSSSHWSPRSLHLHVHQRDGGLLNLTAIAANLLRSVVHTFRSCLGIRLIWVRERVLILGGAVANPLLGTVAICWAGAAAGRADGSLALFVLTRCSARLAHVIE